MADDPGFLNCILLGKKQVHPAAPSQADADSALHSKAQEVLTLTHFAWCLGEQTELRLQVAENQRGYRDFMAMLSDLPHPHRPKLLNRIRRRHVSADQALAINLPGSLPMSSVEAYSVACALIDEALIQYCLECSPNCK